MEAALNAAVDAITGNITACSLHTADPGTTGTSEVTGGTYARQTPTFGAASGGSAATTGDMTFDVPSGQTVSWIGLWAGATFYGKDDVVDEAYGSDGQYVVNTGSTIAIVSA